METPLINPQQRGDYTSASNAHADLLCAGRHLAQYGIPDERSSDSIFGTRVHDALAKGNGEGLTPQEEDIYESCKAIETKVLPKVFGPEIENMLAHPDREKRFWIEWSNGMRHSGQIDSAYRYKMKALIVEYKALPGDVADSPRNMQLRDQAVLYDFNNQMLSEVATVVIQPLVTHSPEICIYKREDLQRARDEMFTRVFKSNQPDSPRTPGEVQCKFCKAKSKCPEYTRFAAGEVANSPGSLMLVPVDKWTPQQRALFLERASIVEKWIDTTKGEMKKLLKADPNSIPGYELKAGRNMSTIINAQKVFENFSALGGTLDQFMGCVEIGKGKLEVEMRTVTEYKGKKLKEAVEAVIGDNVNKSVAESSISKKGDL